jgi:acetolactate synthase-1/2/3 large subunit
MHRAQLTLEGCLARNLRALTDRLVPHSRPERWLDGTPARVRTALAKAFAAPAGAERLSPELVVEVVGERLAPETRVTLDTGAHRIVTSQALRVRWPGQLLQSNGLCTMGYALPCAIGAALAAQRPVIAMMGDAGFEMVAGELATLRDLDLPVTLIVFDDQALALIALKQREAGLPAIGVRLGATDHVAVARAFGGRGTRVSNRGELELALDWAAGHARGFTLISCAIAQDAYVGRI